MSFCFEFSYKCHTQILNQNNTRCLHKIVEMLNTCVCKFFWKTWDIFLHFTSFLNMETLQIEEILSSERQKYPNCTQPVSWLLLTWGALRAINGSDNGLSPVRHQAIIWTNAGLLSNRPLRIYFSENLIKIQQFSLKKMHLKMSSAKWRPSQCVDQYYNHWDTGGCLDIKMSSYQ